LTVKAKKTFQVKPEDYINAIIEGNEFFIQFQKFSPEVEAQIVKIVHRYLEQYDLLFHKDTILSIVKELVNNAIKANLKRIYFTENNLDINNNRDYRNGMENFKSDVFSPEHAEKIDEVEGSGYFVRVTFSVHDERINLNIANNITILKPEFEKIKSRVNKAFKYNDISDAFGDVLDDSEGAGLGLIMAIMLLKNSGFPKDSFKISRNEKITAMNVSIPYNITPPETHYKIADEILHEIKNIPALPGNIKEIRAISRNPESTVKDIASAISRDPGLTASIIKLSNSAGYVTMNKIESIEDAVKVIGIKGLNTLLVATGVQKIVEDRYKKFESIWKDSYKRAFYAQLLLKRKFKKTSMLEQVYLSALLSDIGKIVMLSVNPNLLSKLKSIAGIKGIDDTTLIEEISLGISHSALGALICKKWNFHESLTKTIETHHRPHRADKELVPQIYTVYLADIFVEIEKNKFRYEIIDDDVLEYFHFTKKESFEDFHNIIKTKYDESGELN